jgi:hypothetical protein
MQIITFDEIIGLNDLISLFRISGIFDLDGAGCKNEVIICTSISSGETFEAYYADRNTGEKAG